MSLKTVRNLAVGPLHSATLRWDRFTATGGCRGAVAVEEEFIHKGTRQLSLCRICRVILLHLENRTTPPILMGIMIGVANVMG